ncbi:hypothetical protein MVEN_02564500 [Mycena venus]|uniref:Arrestin-like N-terminal domain-containing protein n=1 Tax=Mycena venus TaxID=2733690 RepID=A0A8H6WSQ4_9AGAR|nr:hypothetical protein MVEN_02564500 [Mycena venus]
MTETIQPPSYDEPGDGPQLGSSQAVSNSPEILLAYTRRPTPPPTAQIDREPKEFTSGIKNRGGTCATFTVRGDPRLSKAIPVIIQGSNLVGSAQLALRSSEAIQAVCILIRGEIVFDVDAAPSTFLKAKHILWSAAEGDPQAAGNSGKSIVKLKGDYHWPFSFPVPPTFRKDGQTFWLPHAVWDQQASFRVKYTAELCIVRGKLKLDDRTSLRFAYCSMQQLGPPSALRQLTYQEKAPLLGPEADAEGWQSQSASVQGTLFSSHTIEVKFTFSLASPLSYTRGASIPCAMTIETKDPQALDLLSSPSAVIVYLECASREKKERVRWSNPIKPCGQAVFWPPTEGTSDNASHQRRLMGEIHLRPSLQPSFALPEFCTEYAVVVFPFQATGFKPLNNSPLLSQEVEILTRYAPGPRQKTYTPPTYETRNDLVRRHYQSLAKLPTSSGFLRTESDELLALTIRLRVVTNGLKYIPNPHLRNPLDTEHNVPVVLDYADGY